MRTVRAMAPARHEGASFAMSPGAGARESAEAPANPAVSTANSALVQSSEIGFLRRTIAIRRGIWF
jgi:hypothetical protein